MLSGSESSDAFVARILTWFKMTCSNSFGGKLFSPASSALVCLIGELNGIVLSVAVGVVGQDIMQVQWQRVRLHDSEVSAQFLRVTVRRLLVFTGFFVADAASVQT